MSDGPKDADSSSANRGPPSSGSFKRTSQLPIEDLSDEWALQGCATIEFEGQPRPSLGRIALLSRLGRGGMGVVYYGVNPRLGTEVAVKILPRSMHEEQDDVIDRFVREARLAAQIRSDHLITVLDVDKDSDSGAHFLVMEYVRGKTGADWNRAAAAQGKTGVPELAALSVCVAATKGLTAAHLEGILHRDVKPENVLIPMDDRGRLMVDDAKISDLGLAKLETSEEGITATSIGMGTPGYMPPEQARDARKAKKPADVFGMGATLYGLLTGNPPFTGNTPMETLMRTFEGKYTPAKLARPDLSPTTLLLLDRCLANDPSERFPDALALLEALQICRQELKSGRPTGHATASRLENLVRRPEQGKQVVTPSLPVRKAPFGARPHTSESPTGEGVAGPGGRLRTLALVLVAAVLLAAVGIWWAGREPPPPPGLQVSSRPPGATVTIDGQVRGSTPLFVENLSGTHAIGISLPGYEPYSAPEFVLPAGERKEIEPVLERIVVLAGIDVSSEPDAAQVFVDGTARGRTPLFVPDLAFGNHSVRVSLPDYDDFRKSDVPVSEAESTPVHAVLVRSTGRLEIRAGAPGAAVALERKGEPPKSYAFELDEQGALATDVEAGLYRLRASRNGFEPHTGELRVSGGETAATDLDMREHDGALSVASKPVGAEVVVDGTPVGRTPLQDLTLAAGTHRVVLNLLEHGSETRDIRVRGDVVEDLGVVELTPWCRVDLTRLGEGVAASVDGTRIEHGQRLPPAPTEVVLERAGYAPQRIDVDTALGTVASIAPRPWDEFQARLELEGLPEGTRIFVEGERTNETSLTFARDGSVAVRLVRPGFAEVRRDVPLVLGAAAPLPDVEWTAVETRLFVTEWGGGVSFTLRRGSKRIQHGDIVPPGEHLVYAKRNDGKRVKFDVEVVSQPYLRLRMPPMQAEPVIRALDWLAGHQAPNGGWDTDGFDTRCKGEKCSGPGAEIHDVGVSALALRCFLGAGRGPGDAAYGQTVARAIDYLLGTQDADGCFGGHADERFIYGHASATAALAEAYNITQDERLHAPVERAVALIDAARNPYLGWRYGLRSGVNDTSVTCWVLEALNVVRGAGFTVPDEPFEGGLRWIDKLTDPEYGRTGYDTPGGPPRGDGARIGEPGFDPYGIAEKFPADRTESMTAAALVARLVAGQDARNDIVAKGADLILRKPPLWSPAGGTIDMYYWFYGTRALYGIGGTRWRAWHQAVDAQIVAHQRGEADSHALGSWDPIGAWGAVGGRVYATALMCLALEDHFRLEDVFARR